jgi:hypothetical protein
VHERMGEVCFRYGRGIVTLQACHFAVLRHEFDGVNNPLFSCCGAIDMAASVMVHDKASVETIHSVGCPCLSLSWFFMEDHLQSWCCDGCSIKIQRATELGIN